MMCVWIEERNTQRIWKDTRLTSIHDTDDNSNNNKKHSNRQLFLLFRIQITSVLFVYLDFFHHKIYEIYKIQ